jgi:hypothetical protein
MDTQEFKKVNSSVACSIDYNLKHEEINSCFLTVDMPIQAMDIAVMRVNHTRGAKAVEKQNIKITDTISKGDLSLQFKGGIVDESKLRFELTDKLSGKSEILSFSLGYWASYIDYNGWLGHQNSGDYIFRPATGQYTPEVYSKF